MKVSLSPDYNPLGLIGLKAQTDQLTPYAEEFRPNPLDYQTFGLSLSTPRREAGDD